MSANSIVVNIVVGNINPTSMLSEDTRRNVGCITRILGSTRSRHSECVPRRWLRQEVEDLLVSLIAAIGFGAVQIRVNPVEHIRGEQKVPTVMDIPWIKLIK